MLLISAPSTDISASLISFRKMKVWISPSLQSRYPPRFKICNLSVSGKKVNKARGLISVDCDELMRKRYASCFVLSYHDEDKHSKWIHQRDTQLVGMSLQDAETTLLEFCFSQWHKSKSRHCSLSHKKNIQTSNQTLKV